MKLKDISLLFVAGVLILSYVVAKIFAFLFIEQTLGNKAIPIIISGLLIGAALGLIIKYFMALPF